MTEANSLSGRKFTLLVLGSMLSMAALLAAFNVVIDPYLVFGRPRTAGINQLKPAVATHEPMMKAYLASRVAPKTLILGSSRSGIGLRPDSPSWPASAEPVFNLSVVGSTLGQQMKYLQLVGTNNPQPVQPRHIVVGLDFESFLFLPTPDVRAQSAAPSEQDQRLAALATGGSDAKWQRAQDAFNATLTSDALLASLSTLTGSMRGSANDLGPAGRTSEWQLKTWTQADGAHKLFEQKIRLNALQLGRTKLQLGPPKAQRETDLMQDVSALLAWARERDARVTLVFQPSHAAHMLVLDSLGYWADIEQWKRAVLTQAELAKAKGLKVEVWSMGGFEPEFTEPVQAGGRAALQWFWDPVHYSSALGDRIVATIMRQRVAPAAGDTGKPSVLAHAQMLTVQTIDDHLAGLRTEKQAYRGASPQLESDLMRWMPKPKAADPKP